MNKSEHSIYNDPVFSDLKSPLSAMNVKLGVRFVVTGVLHSDYWEGSCRVGSREDLSPEGEKARMRSQLESLKRELKSRKIPPEIELIEPTMMHCVAEKGNPDIVLSEEQIKTLEKLDSKTDVYVVLSQFSGVQIAKRFRKPVVMLQQFGWAVDMPAAIRAMGIDSFHAESMDAVFEIMRVFAAKKAFSRTKLLNVTNFPKRAPWGVVSGAVDVDGIKQRYGMDYEYVDYKTFFGEMDKLMKDSATQDRAETIARLLEAGALKNSMTTEDIKKSVLFYLAALDSMVRRNCNVFTIECFELCCFVEPMNRRFTPCLAHALLKDTGYPSACEGDINALLAMTAEMYLSRKAAYMGNPTVNKQSNILNIHHSVASLKMEGLDGDDSPYEIYNFTHSGFGATLRHDFNSRRGRVVTVGRFDPSASKILVTKGTITGGGGLEGLGCAQNVDIQIPNGYEFWRESQNFGHHLACVYGDYINSMRDLGQIMGFEVVVR
jgi:L-fucose isomerase-like protein